MISVNRVYFEYGVWYVFLSVFVCSHCVFFTLIICRRFFYPQDQQDFLHSIFLSLLRDFCFPVRFDLTTGGLLGAIGSSALLLLTALAAWRRCAPGTPMGFRGHRSKAVLLERCLIQISSELVATSFASFQYQTQMTGFAKGVGVGGGEDGSAAILFDRQRLLPPGPPFLGVVKNGSGHEHMSQIFLQANMEMHVFIVRIWFSSKCELRSFLNVVYVTQKMIDSNSTIDHRMQRFCICFLLCSIFPLFCKIFWYYEDLRITKAVEKKSVRSSITRKKKWVVFPISSILSSVLFCWGDVQIQPRLWPGRSHNFKPHSFSAWLPYPCFTIFLMDGVIIFWTKVLFHRINQFDVHRCIWRLTKPRRNFYELNPNVNYAPGFFCPYLCFFDSKIIPPAINFAPQQWSSIGQFGSIGLNPDPPGVMYGCMYISLVMHPGSIFFGD